MARQAAELEGQFTNEASRGERPFALNESGLCPHAQVISDHWMAELGLPKIWGTSQQFGWLEGSMTRQEGQFLVRDKDRGLVDKAGHFDFLYIKF